MCSQPTTNQGGTKDGGSATFTGIYSALSEYQSSHIDLVPGISNRGHRNHNRTELHRTKACVTPPSTVLTQTRIQTLHRHHIHLLLVTAPNRDVVFAITNGWGTQCNFKFKAHRCRGGGGCQVRLQ